MNKQFLHQKALILAVDAGIREGLFFVQDSSCENVIQRDINRTFPAHDFFKEAGGLGQDSLYRISKAYAVYDSEVGYCQGLSFLAATLLLHVSTMITELCYHITSCVI
jgi:hypothetical protein